MSVYGSWKNHDYNNNAVESITKLNVLLD